MYLLAILGVFNLPTVIGMENPYKNPRKVIYKDEEDSDLKSELDIKKKYEVEEENNESEVKKFRDDLFTEVKKSYLERFVEKMVKATSVFQKTDGASWDEEFEKCRKESKKYYKDFTPAKWDEEEGKSKMLKDVCKFMEKDVICMATNKTFNGKVVETLKSEEEKEMAKNLRKGAALACKTFLIGNDNCRADCNRILEGSNENPVQITDVAIRKTDEKMVARKPKTMKKIITEIFPLKINFAQLNFAAKGAALWKLLEDDKTFKQCHTDIKRKYEEEMKPEEVEAMRKRIEERNYPHHDAFDIMYHEIMHRMDDLEFDDNCDLVCPIIEETICLVTNDFTKIFVEKLTEEEKEIFATGSEAAVLACKAFSTGYDRCQPDCDKLSAVSLINGNISLVTEDPSLVNADLSFENKESTVESEDSSVNKNSTVESGNSSENKNSTVKSAKPSSNGKPSSASFLTSTVLVLSIFALISK